MDIKLVFNSLAKFGKRCTISSLIITMLTKYGKLQELTESAKKILLISHRNPDADTLGGAISLKIWLQRIGKEVVTACVDVPHERYGFLPHIDEFVSEFDLKSFDLIIVVDSGASYMTNFHLKYDHLLDGDIPVINIDHHASNDGYGTLNVVDSMAASVTVILYRFFTYLGVEVNKDMATCLLAGIYGDTGSFMHTNTDEEVYAVAAELVAKGAHIAEISKRLFRTNDLSTLKLWGKVLEKAYVTSDNVVMSVVKSDDMESVDGDPDKLSGVIDYLSMVPGSKFAVLINEDRKGNVKGSFRTRDNGVDVSKIAAIYGGGGHSKASGFSVPGEIKEELRYTIVSDDLSKKSLDF